MLPSAPVRALIMCALVSAHEAEAQEVSTRTQQEVQNRVVGMLHAIDKLEWRSVAAAFTPRVRIDYTSLFGGEAEVLADRRYHTSRRLPGREPGAAKDRPIARARRAAAVAIASPHPSRGRRVAALDKYL